MEKPIAFIIQARLASTRLPNKIMLPFWEEETILDILINKLKRFKNYSIILATSNSPTNLPLVKYAQQAGISYFQGDESDVLKRFIDAAESQHIEHIIRICSDNPFLDIYAIEQLLFSIKDNDNYDYISFSVNNQPSIKTHFGFWTEYVTLKALKQVAASTNEALYHEHVTNYIYSHPSDFQIKWLPVPECIKNRYDIRLTIDTENDFRTAQTIYSDLYKTRIPTIEDIVKYIDQHPQYLSCMQKEIINNTK